MVYKESLKGKNWMYSPCQSKLYVVVFWSFLCDRLCWYCEVILFFIPATTANDLQLRRTFIPDFIHYFFCPIYLKSWERASISLLMFSAKQENYWYHFYYVFRMTRSLSGDWTRDLPHSKPALYHLAIEEAVHDPMKWDIWDQKRSKEQSDL